MVSRAVITVKVDGLDPITAYLNDGEPGRGGIVVECYGCAWACSWGALPAGMTVRQFVASVHPDYLMFCLIRGRGQFPTARKNVNREQNYLLQIAQAVIEGAQKAAVPQPKSKEAAHG